MRITIFILALLITALIVTLISWALYSHTLLPKDALIIQTHGHNTEVQTAIASLKLGYVNTIDTNLIKRGSFRSSLIWNTCNTAVTLIVFLSLCRIFRIFCKKQQAEQDAAANP